MYAHICDGSECVSFIDTSGGWLYKFQVCCCSKVKRLVFPFSSGICVCAHTCFMALTMGNGTVFFPR